MPIMYEDNLGQNIQIIQPQGYIVSFSGGLNLFNSGSNPALLLISPSYTAPDGMMIGLNPNANNSESITIMDNLNNGQTVFYVDDNHGSNNQHQVNIDLGSTDTSIPNDIYIAMGQVASNTSITWNYQASKSTWNFNSTAITINLTNNAQITINGAGNQTNINNTIINLSPSATTYSGTTAGTINGYLVFQAGAFTMIVFQFSGYENDTTTNQTINYPANYTFPHQAFILSNQTGLTITATTSNLTITSPDSTTTYSGMLIVMGY